MALTGHEKPLDEYSKSELVEIAEFHKIYYKTTSGVGKFGGYDRLSRQKLIFIIKNDDDYKSFPRRGKDRKLISRVKDIRKNLIGTESPESLMDEILSRLGDTERQYPTPGKYYTYIYYAKTPGLLYDRHPLIMAGDILPKGFRGFNYHLGKIRQYNTEDDGRLVSGLFELTLQEFEDLKSVPYRKLIQNRR